MPKRRSRSERVASPSGRSRRPGNTNPSSYPSAFAWSNTLRAPEDNGTLCTPPRLGPILRNRPDRPFQVELRPPRPPHLAASARRQHQHLQCEFRAGQRVGRSNPLHRRLNLRVRQRPLVPDANAVLRQRCSNGVAGRVVFAESLRDRPLHHGSDSLAHHPRRHALPVPEVVGEQHAHHVGGRDLVDRLLADAGQGVSPQRATPLGFVPAPRTPRGGGELRSPSPRPRRTSGCRPSADRAPVQPSGGSSMPFPAPPPASRPDKLPAQR